MIKISFILIFRFFFFSIISNLILIFYLSLSLSLITYLILIFYIISNGDYIII